MRENNDHYRPLLWAGRVDQFVLKNTFGSASFSRVIDQHKLSVDMVKND